jgi:Phage integrase, N-terminal SAM-like domain
MTLLAPTLEAFFTQHMAGHRQASPRTIGSYHDTWRLFLGYALEKTGTSPAGLDIAAIDAGLVSGFLAHLEADRANTARTRNARLAAIRSFFKFAALRHPEQAGTIARVLAIPAKKHGRTSVSYLTADETAALLAAPDTTTWHGRRDHAILALTAQTTLRVTELTGLTRWQPNCGLRNLWLDRTDMSRPIRGDDGARAGLVFATFTQTLRLSIVQLYVADSAATASALAARTRLDVPATGRAGTRPAPSRMRCGPGGPGGPRWRAPARPGCFPAAVGQAEPSSPPTNSAGSGRCSAC